MRGLVTTLAFLPLLIVLGFAWRHHRAGERERLWWSLGSAAIQALFAVSMPLTIFAKGDLQAAGCALMVIQSVAQVWFVRAESRRFVVEPSGDNPS